MTWSLNFPPQGPFQGYYGGSWDGFVTKLGARYGFAQFVPAMLKHGAAEGCSPFCAAGVRTASPP